jgi:DnaK suppressor protein
MTPTELAQMRALLQARQAELIALGDLVIEPKSAAIAERPDEDAQPLTEMSQVIASRRNAERTRELRGISLALRRIHNNPDDYGHCDECDDPIPKGRLELMPGALYCVKCQEARDPVRGGKRKHLRDFD